MTPLPSRSTWTNLARHLRTPLRLSGGPGSNMLRRTVTNSNQTGNRKETQVMNHNLGIGRIVHYVLGKEYKNKGQCRPATIVRTWSNSMTPQVRVQLQVFMDGTNDGAKYANRTCQWATSVA